MNSNIFTNKKTFFFLVLFIIFFGKKSWSEVSDFLESKSGILLKVGSASNGEDQTTILGGTCVLWGNLGLTYAASQSSISALHMDIKQTQVGLEFALIKQNPILPFTFSLFCSVSHDDLYPRVYSATDSDEKVSYGMNISHFMHISNNQNLLMELGIVNYKYYQYYLDTNYFIPSIEHIEKRTVAYSLGGTFYQKLIPTLSLGIGASVNLTEGQISTVYGLGAKYEL